MNRRVTLKDPIRETHLFRSRAVVAGVASAILLLILVSRLLVLQVSDHQHYTTLSHNNRVSIQPLPPTRGLIYDRTGRVVAENLPTFSLELIPERVEDMEATLSTLGELVQIEQSDLARFRNEQRRARRFEEIPLRFRLSDEEVARVAVNRHRLPGVEINARLMRHYPHGELTAHSVGYVGRINERELKTLDPSDYAATNYIGKTGVEKSHEELLHGSVGYQQVETNARGRILRVLERQPPVPGKDLYLNLDVDLQRVAEQAFAGERGALVAVDPANGAVLALVSVPSYDPNLFVNGIPQRIYRELANSPDRPLFNRALRGQYPPGSTTKPFMGLAGLEYHQVGAEHKTYCPGFYQLKGDDHRYRDWKKHGHGWTDLNKAIVESCDVFFYDLAQQLGIDRMAEYMKAFGFGLDTGIDIGGEASGLMPSREWKRAARNLPWFPGETLITGIGQGFMLTTPLQLATTTATLAARGQGMAPRVVRAVAESGAGEALPLAPLPRQPVPIGEPNNWQRVLDAMEEVVHGVRGTARRIGENLAYRAAGKTGTAQVFGIKQDEEYVAEEIAKRLRDHALFVAFAPVEQPRIAVAVIVENGGSGGAVASPIARAVMDRYLLGIDPPAPEVNDGG